MGVKELEEINKRLIIRLLHKKIRTQLEIGIKKLK